MIVVDNGSSDPPTIEDLARPGLSVAVHRFCSPTVSPVAAMNFGLKQARGDIMAAMIDGARMASRGLVRAALAAVALHPRAVVASYNYHLGPKPQHESIKDGYTKAVEDALLASIDWPTGGGRLFEIACCGHCEGWPGPLIESNALFMRRDMWEELGYYETRFKSPGGGAANPDLFARACALPDAQLVKLIGEATFHQIHGGTIANMEKRDALKLLLLEYAKIRKRRLAPVEQPAWLYDSRTGTVTRQSGMK
nr:glycosyltransferase family A protein [Jiella sonneratiae]